MSNPDLMNTEDSNRNSSCNYDNPLLTLPFKNVGNTLTATQTSKCNGFAINEDVDKEFNFVNSNNEINGNDHTIENECTSEHTFQNTNTKTNFLDTTPTFCDVSPNCVQQNNFKYTIKTEIEEKDSEESSNSNLSNSKESSPVKEKLQVGDLIWSKLTGHPWWPAMISVDPLKKIYHREVMNRKCHNIYHVQYFGESERGWTVPNGLMKYEGIGKYKSFVNDQINQATNKSVKRKIIDKFKINPKRLDTWTLAVKEAECALKMTREIRNKELTYVYVNKSEKKSPKNSHKGTTQTQNAIQIEEDKDFKKVSPDSKSLKKLGRPRKEEIVKMVNTEEGVCTICEKPSTNLIRCQGVCGQKFHIECLGFEEVPQDFICTNCFSDQHPCVLCKKVIEKVKPNKCSRAECKNFLHELCLKIFLEELKSETKSTQCPNHFCRSCAIDNPKNQSICKHDLVTCIRCNNAYHSTDECLPAGSYSITPNIIICAKHFENNNQERGTNKSLWCYKCSLEDEPMVQCKFCPTSFHPNCLEASLPDDEDFTCENCKMGKYPRTGDIIWAKLSIYRWWPAKICDIADIPPDQNILPMRVGCFPIHLLGTKIYYWATRKQVHFFRKDDDDKRHIIYNSSLVLSDKFVRGVNLAIDAFKKFNIDKAEKKNSNKNIQKYSPYKFIKVSKPIGQFQLNPFDINDISRCDCDPNSEHPCSSDIDCLNRSLRYECHPNVCRAGEKCENQRFQRFQYPSFEIFKTGDRGWGLKSVEDIKIGQFVNEYVGDLITEEECQIRLKQMHQNNDTNFYFLTVDKDNIIDAGPKGNYSRFFNHSCDPNMQTQKWEVNGNTRVGLFAIKDISAGTELTFNYNLKSLGIENKKCECGAENCSKFIGLRPQNLALTKKSNNNSNPCLSRKRKLEEYRKHDYMCANCHNPGEMFVCNYKNCQKSFHLSCLNMSKPPPSTWKCSYHDKNLSMNESEPAFKKIKYENSSLTDDYFEDYFSGSDMDASDDEM